VRTTTDNEREGGEHPAVKRSDALTHNVHNASPREICTKIHCDSTNRENFENGEVSVIKQSSTMETVIHISGFFFCYP